MPNPRSVPIHTWCPGAGTPFWCPASQESYAQTGEGTHVRGLVPQKVANKLQPYAHAPQGLSPPAWSHTPPPKVYGEGPWPLPHRLSPPSQLVNSRRSPATRSFPPRGNHSKAPPPPLPPFPRRLRSVPLSQYRRPPLAPSDFISDPGAPSAFDPSLSVRVAISFSDHLPVGVNATGKKYEGTHFPVQLFSLSKNLKSLCAN